MFVFLLVCLFVSILLKEKQQHKRTKGKRILKRWLCQFFFSFIVYLLEQLPDKYLYAVSVRTSSIYNSQTVEDSSQSMLIDILLHARLLEGAYILSIWSWYQVLQTLFFFLSSFFILLIWYTRNSIIFISPLKKLKLNTKCICTHGILFP